MGDRGYEKGVITNIDHGDVGIEDSVRAAEDRLAKMIMKKLVEHYRGYPWAVTVEVEHGMAYIKMPMILGANGFALHLRRLAADPGLKTVVEAGGHILERFRLPRDRFSLQDLMNAPRVHGQHDKLPT